MSTNIKWSYQKKFQNGAVILNTGMVLGYKKSSAGEYVIAEDEAETVLRIYREYLAGIPVPQICRELEADGITTKRGTDITCKVGDAPDGMYPVMGIIPFYAEVAIVPSFNSVNGVVIADGASEFAYGQRGFPIRPAFAGHQELYKEPMKLVFKDSMLVDYDGDPVQKARLTKLLADVDPKPDICDEVGLVTTTSIENDMYGWRVDGSHQTHCIHVALGNNRRRGEIIHSDEHVDFDIHEPTLTVDGITVYENGVFNDAVIFENAKRVKNA